MKPWRQHKEPWKEAERLELAIVCKRLGWTRRKLASEMERVASEDAFRERVRRAVEAGDAPRLLSVSPRTTNAAEDSDAAKGYTNRPWLADIEAGEAVPAEYQADISKEGRENHSERVRSEVEAELAKEKSTLDHRLATIRFIAKTQPQRAKELRSLERLIERKLGEIERRALRDAA